jgi:hypothetical protein
VLCRPVDIYLGITAYLDPSLFVRLLVGTQQDFVGLIQRRGLAGFPLQGAHHAPQHPFHRPAVGQIGRALGG